MNFIGGLRQGMRKFYVSVKVETFLQKVSEGQSSLTPCLSKVIFLGNHFVQWCGCLQITHKKIPPTVPRNNVNFRKNGKPGSAYVSK